MKNEYYNHIDMNTMHFAGKEIVMKIERVNENQIRCTLNKDDLASRQLKISELAYGSDKAKELFRDMMQQASYEVGFDAEDIPLMIEAIPISADCIVLIVTKVENPEELDTRFSKFSPDDGEYDDEYDEDDGFMNMESIEDNPSYSDSSNPPTAGDELDIDNNKNTSNGGVIGDDFLNLFSKVREYLNSNTKPANNQKSSTDNIVSDIADSPSATAVNNTNSDNAGNSTAAGVSDTNDKQAGHDSQAGHDNIVKTRIYSFESMDNFCDAAKAIAPIYNDTNSLYKKPGSDRYYLILKKERCPSVDFNKVCNMLSEYAAKETFSESASAYFEEHGKLIIPKHAVRVAATL